MRMFRRRIRPRSSKLAARRRRLLLFRFGGALVLIFGFIGLLWWGATRPALQIATVEVSGNEVVTQEEIERVAQDVLSGSYLFIFPRRNTLWYPQDTLQATVLSSFGRLKSVDVSRENLTTISIVIAERSPVALWCAEGEANTCFFLNEEGLIFAKAPEFTGNMFLRFYGGIEGDPIGQTLLGTGKEFHRLMVFIDSMREARLSSTALRIQEGADLALITEDGSRILFSRNQEYDAVFENLKTVRESEVFKKGAELDVDYIDLRFGNKIYFKLNK